MTPLEAAYAAHDPGSPRFLDAVDFAGRYRVTRAEARRIALESDSAAVWERTWKDETWWKDAEEASVADKDESPVVTFARSFLMHDDIGKEIRVEVVFIHSEEGWSVSVPSLPGCHSQGTTEAEAIDNIKSAVQEYLAAKRDLQESHLADGDEPCSP